MKALELLQAQQAKQAVSANGQRERESLDILVTEILGCADGATKNGPQPRFGIRVQGMDKPVFAFKSVVRGILPTYVPKSGVHAAATFTKNGEWINLTSLAFKFVNDDVQGKINAIAGATKSEGVHLTIQL